MNKAVLEGLLFVVGEDGLTFEQIEDVLDITEDEAKELLMELKKDYQLKKYINFYSESTIFYISIFINTQMNKTSVILYSKTHSIIDIISHVNCSRWI